MNNRSFIIIPAKLNNIPTMDQPLRVAAYCRVSNPAEEQAYSLQTQVQYYTDKSHLVRSGKM